MRDQIYIKGASEHNLKNIDVEIPRDKIVVITGLSGSGKSSLPLIQFTQKVKGDIWNLFHRMPVSSWGLWKSRL